MEPILPQPKLCYTLRHESQYISKGVEKHKNIRSFYYNVRSAHRRKSIILPIYHRKSIHDAYHHRGHLRSMDRTHVRSQVSCSKVDRYGWGSDIVRNSHSRSRSSRCESYP